MTELLRMQNGGCHPVDGCYVPERRRYAGADFQCLAANVVKNDDRQQHRCSRRHLGQEVDGTKIGFIGMTLEGTPTPGRPGRRPGRRVQATRCETGQRRGQGRCRSRA